MKIILILPIIFITLIIIYYFIFIKYRSYERFDNSIESNDIREESTNSNKSLQYYNSIVNKLNNDVLLNYKLRQDIIRYDDCFDKCDTQKCYQLKERKKNFDNCNNCHTDPNKCFKKSIIGGNCNDCVAGEKQIQCNNTFNFGCTNNNNLNDKNGVSPYYVQAKYYSPNSPYNEQCIFCWELDNYY